MGIGAACGILQGIPLFLKEEKIIFFLGRKRGACLNDGVFPLPPFPPPPLMVERETPFVEVEAKKWRKVFFGGETGSGYFLHSKLGTAPNTGN